MLRSFPNRGVAGPGAAQSALVPAAEPARVRAPMPRALHWLWLLAALCALPGAAGAQGVEAQGAGAEGAGDGPAALTWLSCRACHAASADQVPPGGIPALAGRPAEELAALLAGFRDASGSGLVMHRFTAGFSEPELAALASYISGLEGDAR